MPKLIILGTANAIPDAQHENTHLLLAAEHRTILIDCASNPLLRLEKAGVDFHALTDLILTHFHPDHVSGVPLLLMNMWLLGRKNPLHIHGLPYTLDRVETLMGLFGWHDWPGFFPVTFLRLPVQNEALVLETPEFRLLASPTQHFIPGIGLRMEFKPSGKVLVFTSDTEPCAPITALAAGADVLIHEASGALPGHSSAAQAAETARQARVGELLLIHYPAGPQARGDLVAEAKKIFPGPVRLAEDFMRLEV
jgi:ribonuclease Z